MSEMIKINKTRVELNEAIVEALYKVDFKKISLAEVVYKIIEAIKK